VIDIPVIPTGVGVHPDDRERAAWREQAARLGDKDTGVIEMVESVDAKDDSWVN
jgi:hypothetical protein